jgi:hypothetical protein
LRDLDQSFAKVVAQLRERALDAPGAADQDMVGAGHTCLGQDLAGERAEAPLHTVADDRASDLLGDGNADPHRGILIAAVPDEEDEAGHGSAAAAIGGEEVGAASERRQRNRRVGQV